MGTVTHNFSCNFRCCRRYKTVTMNPMVSLFALFATAMAAPVPESEAWNTALPAAGYGYAGLGYAGGLLAGGYAAAPALAGAAIAAPAVAAVAPVAAPAVAIPAPAISVPAPYTTQHVAGPDAVSVHVPEPIVTKKIEYGTRPYVAAYDTTVLKPVLGDIDIAVPTALLGTVSHNAPITVPVPPPVQGEPIIQKVTGPARIVHTHENRVAPAVHTGAVLGGYGGYAAAPVAAVAAPGIAAAWD